MSLQQKYREVGSLLNGLEQARQKQTLAQALNERANELAEVEDEFVGTMRAIRTLREHGIVAESRLPDSSKVTDKVLAIRQHLANAPQDVTKGQTFNQLCRAVKNLTEKCETLAESAWNDHVKKTGPVIDKRLLDQHRDSPRHASAVAQLERLALEVKPLIKKPPRER